MYPHRSNSKGQDPRGAFLGVRPPTSWRVVISVKENGARKVGRWIQKLL
jgi:hypothetical protein